MKLRLGLLIIFLYFFVNSFSQGLMLQGNNYLIDERTTFRVFEKVQPIFKERLSIDFEMAPMMNHPLGYILRIIDEKNNAIYNILYDDYGEMTVFKFNREGKDVLITVKMEREKVKQNHWINISLDFDLKKKSAVLGINGEKFAVNGLTIEDNWSPVIHFGRSEHIIDNLTCGIKNLHISGKNKDYFFPLNESSGEEVHDSSGKVIGSVNNPVWLINRAYHWNPGLTLHSDKVAGSNFNEKNGQIYFFNEDSVLFYDTDTREITSEKYMNKCPIQINLGTNFIDSENGRIYVYEVTSSSEAGTTIASLDLNTFQWTALSTDILPTQLHHHSNYYDNEKRAYTIFGGFGNLRYNDRFYSYMPDINSWDTLNIVGDVITPRYFSSMGSSPNKETLYIFGGMGNESGDQTVGRVYYYELYAYYPEVGVLKKIWEIPWDHEYVVPVRNMVLTDDSTFYTLCYAEHCSHSFLRLYHFNIRNGSYKIVGDSIPIVSEKIKTNANLYYNHSSNELYCIVQEFENDDIASDVKFYSLFIPPVTAEELFYYDNEKESIAYFFTVLVACLIFVILFLFVRRRKERGKLRQIKPENIQEPKGELQISFYKQPVPNSIYLFGDLSLYDRNGKDISYMLSSRLRRAFLLILQYSITENGISSYDLSERLWPGKPEDKVKNSRGVTLNNLRKILSDFDDLSLLYDKGKYKLLFGKDCYCDYKRCIDLIYEDKDGASISDFVDIICRGKFLKSLNDEFFDSFKGSVERELEPVLLTEIEKAYKNESYKLVVSLGESIFNIDSTNERALSFVINSYIKLNNRDEAKRQYFVFTTEYKQITGKVYEKGFTELIL